MASSNLARKSRILLTTAALALLFTGAALWWYQPWLEVETRTEDLVGHGQDRDLVPDNAILTPAGKQIDLPGLRPQGIVLSPNGKLLAVSGKTPEIVMINPDTAEIRQRVPFPAEDELAPKPVSENILSPDKRGQLSFTGLVFSPDGSRLYLSNVNGSIKVFTVDAATGQVAPSFTIALPAAQAPHRAKEIPSGLAVSADGGKLYVVGNLSNQLLELATADGSLRRTWPVGAAPYSVVLARGKAYVSNWGGRRPEATTPQAHAGRGKTVRVNPRTGVAIEGSVSVINLGTGEVVTEIVTGRHASGLAASPDEHHVVVANAADDYLSVIDTANDEVIERIWTKKTPADLFGAAPNAVAFSADGKDLFVCNGSQNAVALVEFRPGRSELEGLLPVGWYPGALAFDPGRRAVHVANIKGRGSGAEIAAGAKRKFISTQYYGTVSLVPLPTSKEEREQHTNTVLKNYRAPLISAALAKPRPWVKPRPVPERAGEPSVFKHVLYIIKENRTYDQVLGDMPEGLGDAELCIYGEKVTPNQHKMARDFVLLDNAYCSGILSADGHNWSCSAITTDYMEKQFAGFPRSYPDGSEDANADALAWSPAGFIWDAALAQNHRVRIFGEFGHSDRTWADPMKKGAPRWRDIWEDRLAKSGITRISAHPTIEPIRPHFCTAFAAWDKDVSDQQRADVFLAELAEWEKSGVMPNLMLMSLPMDHTSGTVPGYPTPAAQVADNDLAFARIVEGVSKSRFWSETCILAIEDDPQNGWDHVSGYRTTAYVISPWTKRKAVIHTQYNQTSLLRTVELILGLPPMNQLDASATPMDDCFAETPDYAPFVAAPAQVPLDEMNPQPAAISDPLLRKNALVSLNLPFDKLDACPEGALNRILWHAAKGSSAPFPEWAVTLVEDADDEE